MKGLSKLFLYMALLLCPCMKGMAQTTGVRKLMEQVGTDPHLLDKQPDTAYVDVLLQLSRAYYGVNADSAFYFARKALDYSERTGFSRGQADSWRFIGNTYEMIGDYQHMMSSYHISKNIALHTGNAAQVGKVDLNIALFYRQMGKYEAARMEIGTDSLITAKGADSIDLAYHLSYLSDMTMHRGHYDSALAFANQAQAVAIAIKDSIAYATFNNDVAGVLVAMGRATDGIRHLDWSLAYYTRMNERLGLTETNNLLAEAWLAAGHSDNALRYAKTGMLLARQMNRKQEMKESAEVLSKIYKTRGDYAASLASFEQYKSISDSLLNDHLDKQLFAFEARYEFERREDSLQADAMHQAQLHQQHDRLNRLQNIMEILLIVILSVLVFVLWRNKVTTRRNHELLMAKNQEIEQQKEAMEHQAVQLLLNNQQKDKLFSIIAHDLRGPLNSLKGLMDLVRESKLPESEIRSMMAELSRNVGYSSELVSNLLFWASSQLNGVVIIPVEIPMRRLMNDILSIFSRQAEEKKICISNEIAPDVIANADLDMTQVILRNLVSNAIKFCKAEDRITISSHQQDGMVEICIADTGVGIKEDVLEKIRRKESVTTYGTAKEKGTGLGMLLCREFAIANQGEFRVESQWGAGSQFYLTMPVAASSSSMSV